MGGMIAMKLLTSHPDRVNPPNRRMGWLREGSPLQIFGSGRASARIGAPSVCVRSLGALAVTEQEVKAIRVPSLSWSARVIRSGGSTSSRWSASARLAVTAVPGAGHLSCILMRSLRRELRSGLDQQAPPRDSARPTG